MSGCFNNDLEKPDRPSSGAESEEQESSLESELSDLVTNVSVSAQQASSNQYDTFSVIGQVAKSEMKSQQYQLSATLVVPAQIPNKRNQ